MQHKLLRQHDGARTWALVLETDEEVVQCVQRFARSQHLAASRFTAIGACRRVVLGYFEWERRDYRRNAFHRQLEVVSLVGDITLKDQGYQVRMHAVFGQENAGALAGHVLEAQVRPTLEIMLTETPAELRRQYDPDVGLALIEIPENSR